MQTAMCLRQFFTHEIWAMDLDRVPLVQRPVLQILPMVLAGTFDLRCA